MLILNRKPYEKIVITVGNEKIIITVVDIQINQNHKKRARLGIDASKNVTIDREEIRKLKEENKNDKNNIP